MTSIGGGGGGGRPQLGQKQSKDAPYVSASRLESFEATELQLTQKESPDHLPPAETVYEALLEAAKFQDLA